MNETLKKVFAFVIVFFLFTFGVSAKTVEELQQEIQQYEAELQKLSSQAKTLSNQIAQFDAQIKLATLKISQTEEKILLLGGRIDQLEESLQSLNKAYGERVVETYKLSRFENNLLFVITAPGIDDVVSRFHYLQRIQEADRNLLDRLQKAQTVYIGEKVDQEQLQEDLTNQKAALDSQKAAKAKLLTLTRNDEKRYQDLLSKARAEIEAIQSIVAGQGKETEVGKVSEGSRIASVIPSSSACSSGAHLHFEVVKDKTHQNPANFLSSKSVTWDNSPDGQFGFSGSWPWPINDPVRITQGYGMTYYAASLRYYGGGPHTGLDVVNPGDYTVKAVRPGTLYLGSIACGGGTLKYVHVVQEDGYDTYYLHVNY
jgi:murein DD-endopeptidase MepM/ murein hydrolase activator NlpD